jgi:hypothetical protein
MIDRIDSDCDDLSLQDELNNFESWSNSSGLAFNGKNANVIVSPDVVNQSTIFTTSEELIYIPAGKDLGISMVSDLTLSKHVLDMCARANHRCKAMFSGDKRRGDQPDSVSVIGSLGFVLIKPDLVASNRLPFS